ncbi:MAG: hypothetical protein GY820_14230, partial [Gammaproteobacteria bacterium]|nr:hypothetical protein [Gammaproteobacteria bacterium]
MPDPGGRDRDTMSLYVNRPDVREDPPSRRPARVRLRSESVGEAVSLIFQVAQPEAQEVVEILLRLGRDLPGLRVCQGIDRWDGLLVHEPLDHAGTLVSRREDPHHHLGVLT